MSASSTHWKSCGCNRFFPKSESCSTYTLPWIPVNSPRCCGFLIRCGSGVPTLSLHSDYCFTIESSRHGLCKPSFRKRRRNKSIRSVFWRIEGDHIKSPVIKSLQEIDRIHRRHNPAKWKLYKHYMLTFHDNMFECVAHSFEVQNSSVLQRALETVNALSFRHQNPTPF